MTDRGSQTTTRLNAWGWTLTLALVAVGTLACMALGAFLGVTFVANDIRELMSSVDTQPQLIGSGVVEIFSAFFLAYIGVHIGGAIGILVGLVVSTLACRRWLVPRLKLRQKFSRLVASGPAAGM
jgi:tetrahydromethanopterin S-methyltransferase subunit G